MRGQPSEATVYRAMLFVHPQAFPVAILTTQKSHTVRAIVQMIIEKYHFAEGYVIFEPGTNVNFGWTEKGNLKFTIRGNGYYAPEYDGKVYQHPDAVSADSLT